MQTDNSNSSPGANADSEQKAEVTTSSQHSTKPHVVGSQSTSLSIEDTITNIVSGKEANFNNSKPMRLSYQLVKLLSGLTIEDAETTCRYILDRAFMVNKNKCLREGKQIFEATISADF